LTEDLPSEKIFLEWGYFILLKRMGLGGFDSFGYLRYLLSNEIDRLEGNLNCCMIGKVGLERSLCRREFLLLLL
jgi:hypothetical protein